MRGSEKAIIIKGQLKVFENTLISVFFVPATSIIPCTFGRVPAFNDCGEITNDEREKIILKFLQLVNRLAHSGRTKRDRLEHHTVKN